MISICLVLWLLEWFFKGCIYCLCTVLWLDITHMGGWALRMKVLFVYLFILPSICQTSWGDLLQLKGLENPRPISPFIYPSISQSVHTSIYLSIYYQNKSNLKSGHCHYKYFMNVTLLMVNDAVFCEMSLSVHRSSLWAGVWTKVRHIWLCRGTWNESQYIRQSERTLLMKTWE